MTYSSKSLNGLVIQFTRLYLGHLDLPLTEIGLQQAEIVAKHIVSHRRIKTIFSSDLQRAAQTGAWVHKLIPTAPLVLDSRLREKCMGKFEGKPWGSIQKAAAKENIEYAAYVPKGGETYHEFEERILAGLNAIIERVVDTTDEVIVTAHGGVIFHLFGYYQNKPNSGKGGALIATNTLPENVSLSTLSVHRGSSNEMEIRIVDYNNTKHLDNLDPSLKTTVRGFSGHATDTI
ncbi:hypothetical protein SARC_10305 [Sphaeroforma arctica JP610]|uniref:Phosphoglycerate mutase n=1 Tax=Sphaeroforma arctica JP610 TaxID=667725 RepID=A0A0L0FMH1_9EUKA|nr:hypothetical protein SARC_10305 [Sphaeroforma arctica JP610]KNC77228.1 hypothetical protein SARC_10305 [Sphaeroforma arctica JP610]|eukprot:XP_014151130.1 hypothetical protein SARC_10305 [Sphaeroforma arctica JP610]